MDTDRILGGTTLTSRVPVRSGELVLRAIRMSPGLLGPGAGVLVTVEPAGAAPPELSLLREEFGLTRRQAQVALLLDQRKSNAEIAGLLGISPHTARRHTEAVMGKLGVTDRREVRPLLSRMEQECRDLDPATNERLSA